MKILLLSLALVFSCQNLFAAADPLPANILEQIQAFGQKKLDAKKDYAEVKNLVETLLALDDEDPARTAEQMLSVSYNKYPKIYDKAFREVSRKKNKEQRKQLIEIRQIMRDFDRKGNG